MTASSTKDYLRFEQPIASGSGRIVMQGLPPPLSPPLLSHFPFPPFLPYTIQFESVSLKQRLKPTVPITFEAQFTAMAVSEAQSACASPSASPAPHKTPNQKTVKTRDTHCVCPVVREEFFATCRCTSCGETLAFYHQVKACTEGEPGVGGEKKTRELRWFLARKEQKLFLAGEEGVGEDEQVGV